MSRATVLGAVAVISVLTLATAAGAAFEVKLTVTPKRPAALEETTVELRTFALLVRGDGSCCRLEPRDLRRYPFRVEKVSPEGKVSRIPVRHVQGSFWRGTVRFTSAGRWVVRLPQFRVERSVSVRPPIPTAPPEGFGALGRPGCDPPSPASGTTTAFRDIFATAVGREELWALPFLPPGARWPTPHFAVFEGLVGKEVKIVFGMTTFHRPFRAIGPSGQVVDPAWGPTFHSSSNWIRQPGTEWGAGFVFDEPGCWRLAVGSRGDVWLLIRS